MSDAITGEVKIDINAFQATFFEEAEEHLGVLETSLVALEDAPADAEILARAFRAAHSIKGSSGMFGFTDIGRFTHALESLLDRLRDGSMSLDAPLAGLLLRGVDLLRELVACARAATPAPESMEPLLVELGAVLSARAGAPAKVDEGAAKADLEAPGPSAAIYDVELAPGPGMLLEGMDPLLLLRNLGALGEVIETRADTSAFPDFDDLDPERCYLAWTVRLSTTESAAQIRDVFAFVEDSSRIEVKKISEAPESPSLVALVAPAATVAANTPPPPQGPQAAQASGGSFRVSTQKVDKLIDLVGELVIAQSMIASVMTDFSDASLPRLQEAVAEMERNTRELQERVMSVRMVPIHSIFGRFPRVVRDLAAATGKKVTLHTFGEETEIDKMVVEQLSDPLTHVLRNAIDHGIEPPEERRERGKDEEATITMSAHHQGGSVHIEVTDDGRGLDANRIRQKAISLGLVGESEALTDDQIHALIFRPGFSTAEKVSNVSGRGVGMDVVKRNVEQLNGVLTIESSPGVGCRIRIKLPLTLAIIDGLTLRIGTQTFVLPLVSIIESFRPTRDLLGTVVFRGEVVRFRGESVPLLRLHELWRIPNAETDPTRALVVIVETATSKLGLLVDEVLGQPQVVVKSLDRSHRRSEGVMGATILGDGHVALILDVQGLGRIACGAGADKSTGKESSSAAVAVA